MTKRPVERIIDACFLLFPLIQQIVLFFRSSRSLQILLNDARLL